MVEQKSIVDLRNDFPTLKRKVNGKDLVYFDNGATAQKPQVVIDRINQYYQDENSNIHRGVHTLSQEATAAYEEARRKIQAYINAPLEEEVIYTKGTTDGINLVANGFTRGILKEGDEVVGNETRVKVIKNKVAPPFKQTEFQIMYGKGIYRLGEVVDLGVQLGFVDKAGAWYSYKGDKIGQGKKNACEFLAEHTEIGQEIESRIRAQLLNEGTDGGEEASVTEDAEMS